MKRIAAPFLVASVVSKQMVGRHRADAPARVSPLLSFDTVRNVVYSNPGSTPPIPRSGAATSASLRFEYRVARVHGENAWS